MRYGKRISFCISSQVGCPLDCVFCQTGKMDFGRNLTMGEILDQICALKRECADEVDKVNLVFMGMGEPMLNYRSVIRTIRVLNDEHGFDMGARRITVSTAGHPRRMRTLAESGARCSLALSLNGTTDPQRAKLMPRVSRYSIAELLDACRYFHEKTARRVTLEYVMLSGENIEDAPNNVTRFLVISKQDTKPTSDDKTGLLFSTAHKAGALADVLNVFKSFGVNLTNVNTITLGFGNRNNPVAGGAGMMFFDDIRLYRPAP